MYALLYICIQFETKKGSIYSLLIFSVGNIPDYSDLFGEISDDDDDDNDNVDGDG